MKRNAHASAATALLAQTRRQLLAQILLQALLWGTAAGLLALALAGLLQPWLGTPAAAWRWLPAAAAASAAAAWAAWRQRQVWQPAAVALWVEEQLPQLRYALLALAEGQPRSTPPDAARHATEQLERQLRATVFAGPAAAGRAPRPASRLAPHLRQRLRRTLAWPALALLAAVLLQAAATAGWQHRLAARWLPAPPGAPAGNGGLERFGGLQGTLTPPAYTGWPAQALENIDSIRGLSGSHVALRGIGPAEGISAQLEQQSATQAPTALEIKAEGRSWSLAFTLPGQPMALVLAHGDTRRVIVLEPRSDAAPLVRLHLPERDETLADAGGMLELAASLSDDIALTQGWFEIIAASGEGEGSYAFQTSTLLESRFDGARGELQTRVPLETFGLRPGGQLSIRAVGVDGNDLSGPGIGYSETRTIRLAREQPQDQAEVVPAPPALDESLMSLRMLIRSTERLEARREAMERRAFVREAAPLARHAGTIREKIQSLVDETSQGGSFPVPPLLAVALEAMWEGARSMAIADTEQALPQLHRAHEAIKALSMLSRYFLRGETLPAHADVDGVRMSGEEPVAASARSPRQREDSARQRMAAQLREAMRRLHGDPAAAREQLALLRVQSLRELPQAAAPLEQALQALRGGQDASAVLEQLHTLLAGEPFIESRLPSWTPAPLLQIQPPP